MRKKVLAIESLKKLIKQLESELTEYSTKLDSGGKMEMRDAQAIANLSTATVFTEILNLLCEAKDVGLKEVMQKFIGGDTKQPIGFQTSGSQYSNPWSQIFPGPLPQLMENAYNSYNRKGVPGTGTRQYNEYEYESDAMKRGVPGTAPRRNEYEYRDDSMMRRGVPGTGTRQDYNEYEYRDDYNEYRNDGQEYHEPSKMKRGVPGTGRGRRGYRSEYEADANVNVDEIRAEAREVARDEARRTATETTRQEMEYRADGQEYETDTDMEMARRMPRRSKRTGRFIKGYAEARTTPSNEMRADIPRMEMDAEAEAMEETMRRAEAKRIEQERIANENYLRGVNEARSALDTRTEAKADTTNELKRGVPGTGAGMR